MQGSNCNDCKMGRRDAMFGCCWLAARHTPIQRTVPRPIRFFPQDPSQTRFKPSGRATHGTGQVGKSAVYLSHRNETKHGSVRKVLCESTSAELCDGNGKDPCGGAIQLAAADAR
ncbi:unnamed protein product [Mycena citricolor]|uniref:Uncharacterized protein n=1 Tax=Mycena citricolor TaxID=2018698 RepID=A0AAD2Q4F6_9AGAR|nr:unnamed protein product [Mycena citricolor]